MTEANQDRLKLPTKYKNLAYRLQQWGFLRENGFIYKWKNQNRKVKQTKSQLSEIVKIDIKNGSIIKIYDSLSEADRERFKEKGDVESKIRNRIDKGLFLEEDGFIYQLKSEYEATKDQKPDNLTAKCN